MRRPEMDFQATSRIKLFNNYVVYAELVLVSVIFTFKYG